MKIFLQLIIGVAICLLAAYLLLNSLSMPMVIAIPRRKQRLRFRMPCIPSVKN